MRYDPRRLGVAAVCCAVLAGCGIESGSPSQPTPIQTVSYVVTGVVTEVVDGQTVPLEGAFVEDTGIHFGVRTGRDGSYLIDEVGRIPPGEAHFVFSKAGYRAQNRAVALTGGGSRVDVTLVRQ